MCRRGRRTRTSRRPSTVSPRASIRSCKLSYRAPELVAAMLADSDRAGESLDVLDAGCGTGLCGPLLAPYARAAGRRRFVGRHAEQANAKQVYNELCKVELTAYLRGSRGVRRDRVGRHAGVLRRARRGRRAAAAGALRPGGCSSSRSKTARRRTGRRLLHRVCTAATAMRARTSSAC